MRITLLLLFLAAFSCTTSESLTPERPNILFLFADDLTFSAIHALGNQEIKTPNIDRLANTGTTFTHAYNMGGWHGAICMASRAMLISGQKLWSAQSVSQQWSNGDSAVLKRSWGRIMAQHDYNTYMSGKWHVSAPADYVFDQAKHVRPGMPGDKWGELRENLNGRKLTELITPDLDLQEVMPPGYHRPNNPDDDSWSPSDTSFGGYWAGGKHWSEVLK
ncbi:MAG: sulfatase-like hydrolase/transferase, partial [Bacteroidetes bacterium]|nr:sulfatase-like hydrolase/transferase [Bacteroidota bacterium]